MSYEKIIEAVKKLKLRYEEREPIALCSAMGIKLHRTSLGTGDTAIKGFFLEHNRIKTITVNCDLPDMFQDVIIAHEIGHSVLHCKNGLFAFHDALMFNRTGRLEREANLFAAELLLDDKEVLAALNESRSFFNAAATLCVPAELLDFKYHLLNWKGYEIGEPPLSAQSDFLANVEIPKEESIYEC